MNDDFEKLANHPTHRKNLIEYLKYRIPEVQRDQVENLLDRCGKKKITSAAALDELSDLYNNARISAVGPANSTFAENRIKSRLKDLDSFKAYIKKEDIKQYVDIGCGNGSITAGIGKYLGLGKDSVFGADIVSWAGHEHKQEIVADFTFKTIAINKDPVEYKIDLADKSCQFVTLLMVLHHINDDLLPYVFGEIFRILANDGFILIREHDSPNWMVDSLINIEHGIFQTVLESLSSGEEFGKTYFAHYRTSREWRRLLEQFGFIHIASTQQRGSTRGYYSLFSHSKKSIPINGKSTPELVKEAELLGVSAKLIRSANNDEEIKQLLVSK